ncbi:MAG: hypothetical protein ACJ79A_17345 [Gemmatimonadaceae bacterium]
MRSSSILAASSLLAVAVACGSDASGPTIGPATTVTVATSPTATGVVKTAIGNFAVKVADANGNGVAGTVVSFSATGGGGASFAPATATADGSGIATTVVTLGSKIGDTQLAAHAAGVSAPAIAKVTATPGPLASLVTTPKALRFFAAGDTARITFALEDEFANPVTGATINVGISDPTLVSVSPQGLVTALRAGGSATITVSAAGRSDAATARVLAENESPCVDLVAPSTIGVGAVVAASGAYTCLTGAAGAAAEYTLVAYNSSQDGSTQLATNLTAWGLATPPSALKVPSASGPMLSRSVSGLSSTPTKVLDERFHQRLLTEARSLSRLFGLARSTRNARLSATRTSSAPFSPSASFASIPATVAVGDILRLNVSSSSCDAAILRGFRVTAIGAKTVVLADTLNPANGFTDADYVKFAARFDTLVYPLDVDNFGAPSDLDQNGKVAVLFTKYVNELTPANSDSFVGGFFHPRDLFPKAGAGGLQGCVTSNEGEMFYMLVPDPSGVVNGNKHTLGFVDTLTVSVLAHEFQHLINAGRRLYVNTGAEDFEDTWLNEGLSHVAEELLYYHESGMQPRQGLTDALIRTNPAKYAIWKADAASNFSRLLEYIEDPGAASAIDDVNDELSTRGASWSFLRYAVDRAFTSDAGVWTRFSNSTQTGLNTVALGLQTDPRPYLADFALANYISDLGVSNDPRFRHKSWNYRDIFSNTFGTRVNGVFTPNGFYPLKVTGLANRVATSASVRGGSATYYRLAVPAGREALVSFASGLAAADPSFVFSVVRTK